MQATTLCALMLKAKKVFAKEQTFLSFPISPLPYAPQQLDFFDRSTAAALLESNRHRKEFSIIVDAIATGEAWQPTGDLQLSETYDAVLDSAELAISTRTAEEESEYQAARAVLRTDDHDSDKLVAFRKCRDAYLLAEQRYTAVGLTAQTAGPQEKQEWQSTIAPLLRRELAELLQSWMFDGFKEEIETAQTQAAILGARSPALTWADWRGRFNPATDLLNDPTDGVSVAPSGFSPSNAIAEEAWRSFTLSPAEVTALLQEAPPAWLTTMLGSALPGAGQAISFEFSSAAIVRPWFDPGLFKARFWKFSDESRQLSDGKSPATGECPAYVAALVFARKVLVTGGGSHPAPAPVGPFEGFHFVQATQLVHATVLKREFAPAIDATINPREVSPGLLVRKKRFARAMPEGAHLAVSRPAFAVSHSVFLHEAAVALPTPVVAKATLDARVVMQFEHLKIDRSSHFVHLAAPVVFNPVPPVVATPTPTPPPVPDDNTIYILAFICKPLQQCPNPDPELQW